MQHCARELPCCCQIVQNAVLYEEHIATLNGWPAIKGGVRGEGNAGSHFWTRLVAETANRAFVKRCGISFRIFDIFKRSSPPHLIPTPAEHHP
jgi:hypothetical protein